MSRRPGPRRSLGRSEEPLSPKGQDNRNSDNQKEVVVVAGPALDIAVIRGGSEERAPTRRLVAMRGFRAFPTASAEFRLRPSAAGGFLPFAVGS
jgi:hypothetical protein